MLLLSSQAHPDASGAPVRYRVAIPDPRTHEYEIEMRVPALPDRASPEIVFPAWAPGSYLVRDFVRHVYGLRAADDRGRALVCERLDKQRWRVGSAGRAFRVSYRVFAFETSVRTSFLDESHAYWNGSSLFFYVDGELRRPCDVEVAVPRRTPAWRVATSLPAVRGEDGVFRARDFDELVDSPFEVGSHATHRFSVGRTRFEVALYGRTNADLRRLVADMKRIATTTGAMFGGFPFSRYLFITHMLPSGSGGLEHANSVTLDVSGLAFDGAAGYHGFAALVAHEFFHVWNVKRIHDTVLGPFDYTRENYTRLLWFHEGFTDYMARLLLVRSGVWKPADLLRWIGEEWPKYTARPGRSVTPLADLSFEAWIKEYKPAENHYNAAVSYYTKGLWAGMALDLTLRRRTRGVRGLEHVFRRLWDDFGRAGRGIVEADVRAATARVAGAPMGSFFERYVHDVDELPLPALWKDAGLALSTPPPWEPSDPKSPDRDPVRERRARAWSGVTFAPIARKAAATVAPGTPAVIRNVIPDSPGFRAGLTFGDEIVAVDGARVDADGFGKRIGDRAPGDRVRVAFFRQDELGQTDLTLAESPERRLVLKPDPRASSRAKAVGRGWLGG